MIERFKQIRNHTENLCLPLKVEDYIPQGTVDVSPPKWHLAHTTWFFETFILKPHAPNYQVFHEKYNYLFNSYYESIGDRVFRDHRGHMSRPTVSEVYDYRAYVNEHIVSYLERADFPDSLREVMELGLQHEQQHQELLITDLKYTLAQNPMFPAYDSGNSWKIIIPSLPKIVG